MHLQLHLSFRLLNFYTLFSLFIFKHTDFILHAHFQYIVLGGSLWIFLFTTVTNCISLRCHLICWKIVETLNTKCSRSSRTRSPNLNSSHWRCLIIARFQRYTSYNPMFTTSTFCTLVIFLFKVPNVLKTKTPRLFRGLQLVCWSVLSSSITSQLLCYLIIFFIKM